MIDCFNWGSAGFLFGQAGGWTQPQAGQGEAWDGCLELFGYIGYLGLFLHGKGCPALAQVSPHPWGGDTWGQGSAGLGMLAGLGWVL